jgi:hypothetical protein
LKINYEYFIEVLDFREIFLEDLQAQHELFIRIFRVAINVHSIDNFYYFFLRAYLNFFWGFGGSFWMEWRLKTANFKLLNFFGKSFL